MEIDLLEASAHPQMPPPPPRSLERLVQQLGDLYRVERWRGELLPGVARNARCTTLKLHFRILGRACHSQIDRLEHVFKILDVPIDGPGWVAEHGAAIGEPSDVSVGTASTDAALVVAARALGNREVAGYGNACSLARDLGHPAIVNLLARSLWEHSRSNDRLDRIDGSASADEA